MAALHIAAGQGVAMALIVTHISASVASLVWMVIEWRKFGRPSVIGMVTGMVAGLATVTPASGLKGIPGKIILGLVGGYGCYLAVDLIRNEFYIDDSLDVFAVHSVGGVFLQPCLYLFLLPLRLADLDYQTVFLYQTILWFSFIRLV